MKYTIVSGSHRNGSQSEKVSRFLADRIGNRDGNTETFLLNLAGNPLPLWDESVWSGGDVWKETWQPMAKEIQSSDALIWVVPEWNGMVPSGVLNLLHLCGHGEVGHKPALIVSISASRNGAYPISQMREGTTKNNRMLYIPEHIIVRDVKEMLNSQTETKSEDEAYLVKRIDYCLDLLGEYAKSLQSVRKSGVIDHDSFANGM